MIHMEQDICLRNPGQILKPPQGRLHLEAYKWTSAYVVSSQGDLETSSL